MSDKKNHPIIPNDHPRAKSLHYRHQLVDGMLAKVVTPSGLCAHGRGEAYDYILGEQTTSIAKEAIQVAVASILLANHPIISVNGNVAALVPEEIVKLSEAIGAPLEVNIFYKAEGRLEAIAQVLRNAGATSILGLGDIKSEKIVNLSSNRGIVDPRGIYNADVVLVPLEDGDRAESLVVSGKTVIAIDLNPLSRTAMKSQITIVDNLVRCIPRMTKVAKEFKGKSSSELQEIVNNFNQKANLYRTLEFMINYLQEKIKILK